mgnify:FL=1
MRNRRVGKGEKWRSGRRDGLMERCCRTGFDSDGLTATKITKKMSLSLEFVIEIMPIMRYIGVVFPFMGLLS